VRSSILRVLIWAVMIAVVPRVGQAQTISAGAQHTAVVTPDGSVWTWGGNASGQLGDGTNTAHRVPRCMDSLTEGPLAIVVCS
jgi:alpha-tubulin suppressor-like RCC1 family protein